MKGRSLAEAPAPALLGTVIRSVWALELLMMMKGRPAEPWSVDALVRELRASTPLVEQCLDQLVAGGLVRREDAGFVYGPASTALEAAATELEQAYRERPVATVNAIASAQRNNVQTFADAFRFKKGDK